MKHIFTLRLLALLLGVLPGLAWATAPVLVLRGTVAAGAGVDVTAFVDLVEILDAGTGAVVASMVPNASFETTGSLGTGAYGYNPTGASWSFASQSGIATNGSGFNNPTAPAGTHVAFLQSTSSGVGSFSQPLASLITGSYRVRVQLAQRNTTPANQDVEILMNGVVLGSYTPANDAAFHSYTTASAIAVNNSDPFTFSPTSGWPGTLITVNGVTNPLSAITTYVPPVSPMANTIVSRNATSLTFVAPVGSRPGPITVGTASGGFTSVSKFEVIMPPCYEEVDTVSTPANGGYTALPRCDDCYQQVNLGFSFAFYGNTYTSCFISNNGLLSFNSGVPTWTSQAMPVSGYPPMIAPYWSDVDTRPANSGRVWYKLYPDRLVVMWNRVGYYNLHTDKKNTFQLILRRNTVAPAPRAT